VKKRKKKKKKKKNNQMIFRNMVLKTAKQQISTGEHGCSDG